MAGLTPFGSLPPRAGQGQISLSNLTYRLINHRFLKPGTTHELDIPIMGVVFEHYGPVVIPSKQFLSLPPTKQQRNTSDNNNSEPSKTRKSKPEDTIARLPSTSTILNKTTIPAEELRLQNGCLDFFRFLDSRDVRRAVFNRGDATHLQRLNELVGEDLAFSLQFGNDIFNRRVKPQSVFVVAKKWGFMPTNLLFVSSSLTLLSRVKCTGVLTCLLTGEDETGTRVMKDRTSSYAYDQLKYDVNPLTKPKAKPPRVFIPDITVQTYSELRSKLEGGDARADYIQPIHFTNVEISKLLSFAKEQITFSRE
eukprot:TRINITY_DN7465_c0_g3_i1.p1 TRINITY_DN7465_c0_g3~~TRINITY_DN7465_c0_g3_i1.p1  ORF type:complete len:309 (-),score=72.76 TRINITY_DN7465_c0_g3_i1:117-1043(-)